MIIVTGGAGFIGSALAWRLNQRGEKNILIVDCLRSSEKWRNIVPLQFNDYCDKKEFIERLTGNQFGTTVRAIFHMGACSSTTEQNADYLMDNNYNYSKRIAHWREKHPKTRLIYASSAATYGKGENNYMDFEDDYLYKLQPLNMYGYSKHLFDLYAKHKGWLNSIVGLKFFNVFGPNEYHKSEMRSVILKAFPEIQAYGKIKLFKSYRKEFADGMQSRDFIYIKDAVEMTLFFLDNPEVNGIFNIGTGISRTWNDVAESMYSALQKKPCIKYIEMPDSLKKKYQYYTRADLNKIRLAGCSHKCMTLESAISEYICTYLIPDKYLGME